MNKPSDIIAKRVTHLKLHFECPCCGKAIWVDFETKPDDDVTTTEPIDFAPPPKVESLPQGWTAVSQPSYRLLEATCRDALKAIEQHDIGRAAAMLRSTIGSDSPWPHRKDK